MIYRRIRLKKNTLDPLKLVSRMVKQTFMDYLSKDEIISILTSTSKKTAKLSKEEIQLLFSNEIKNKKITDSKIRKSWSKAMHNMFFEEYQRMFTFTPSKKFDTSQKLKNAIVRESKKLTAELKVKLSANYISKLSSSPLHYHCAMSFEKIEDFRDFLFLSLDKQFILSIFPEIGFAIYWPMKKNKKLDFITDLLSALFENSKELKLNALLLRKYATEETINKLGISTPQEIAGFSGLDVIEFRGSNVMLGLSGLKRRHDANVDVITRVGPFTEIESDAISLVCGIGARIKEYSGIEALLNVMKKG